MFRGVLYLFEYGVALVRVFVIVSLVCFFPRMFFMRDARSLVQPAYLQALLPCKFDSDEKEIMFALIKQWYPTKSAIKVGVITADNDYAHKYAISCDTVWYMQNPVASHTQVYTDQMRQLCSAHDLILVDVPTVGLSCVLSCHFLFDLLDNAVVYNIPVLLFDKPNMLGEKIEGPVCSFMKNNRCFKLPFRHGMTLGELARYYNAEVLQGKAVIHIVPVNNYNRSEPSCAKSIYDACFQDAVAAFAICGVMHQIAPLGYLADAGHCNCIMLPPESEFAEQEWYQLQSLLKALGVTSFLYRYSDKDCHGLYRGLKLTDIHVDQIDCFRVLLTIIDFFKASGIPLIFSDQFDHFMGTSLVRQYAKGMISKKRLFSCINKDLEPFYRSAFAHFMYYPLPQLSLM